MSVKIDANVIEERDRALARYEAACRELAAFEAKNKAFFEMLQELLGEQSAALDALEKIARSTNETVGPCKRLATSYRVDVEKLQQAVGKDLTVVGGVSEVVWKVSVEKLRKAEAAGAISPETVKACLKPSTSFEIPKRAVLP